MSQIVRITSQAEGFRRAGMAHPMAATDHKAEVFSEAQLKALQAEPMLMVQLVGASEQSAQPPLIDEARKTAIITAMQAMMHADQERTDKSMWTNDGRPDLKVINANLKEVNAEAISAKVRDQIWAEIKPA